MGSIDVLLRRIGPTNIHLHWVKKEERVTTRIELPRIQLHAVSPFFLTRRSSRRLCGQTKSQSATHKGFVFSGVDASHGKRRSISGSRNVLMLHVRAVGSWGNDGSMPVGPFTSLLRSSPWRDDFGGDCQEL